MLGLGLGLQLNMLHPQKENKVGKGTPIKVACVLSLAKSPQKNASIVTDQENVGQVRADRVLIPLQSANNHIRTNEIGCHKQRFMCACVY